MCPDLLSKVALSNRMISYQKNVAATCAVAAASAWDGEVIVPVKNSGSSGAAVRKHDVWRCFRGLRRARGYWRRGVVLWNAGLHDGLWRNATSWYKSTKREVLIFSKKFLLSQVHSSALWYSISSSFGLESVCSTSSRFMFWVPSSPFTAHLSSSIHRVPSQTSRE